MQHARKQQHLRAALRALYDADLDREPPPTTAAERAETLTLIGYLDVALARHRAATIHPPRCAPERETGPDLQPVLRPKGK